MKKVMYLTIFALAIMPFHLYADAGSFIKAATKGDIKVLNEELTKGIDVNIKDSYGFTALHCASGYGHTEAVKILLKSKADVAILTGNGTTALWLASNQGRTEIVKLLIKAKADVNVKDRRGISALSAAEKNGHKDVAALLKAAGAK